MAEMGIRIVLQGGVAGTAKYLDTQLAQVKLTPLSVKVNIDSSGLNSTTNATKGVSEATQKAEKEITKYWQSLQKTINEYKKQNTELETYIQKLNSVRASEQFKQLSDEKQIKVINSLADAERKLTQVQATRRSVSSLQTSNTNIQNQTIASNIGNLIGGGITTRGTELENVKKLESEQVASINRVRQERIASENRAFDNARRNQQTIDKENQRIASNIGNLIGGGITTRGNQLASTGIQTPMIKPLDVSKANNDLIKLEQSMAKITGSTSFRSATQQQQQSFDAWGRSIQSTRANLDNMSRSGFNDYVRTMRTNISGVNGEIQNVDRSSMHLGNALKEAFIKFPLWLGVSTIIMQTFHQIQQGVHDVIELNKQITQLNITMNLTAEDTQKLVSSAQTFAKTMGTSVREVMAGMLVYANQTESLDSILKKTQADIILTNLSGMSMKDSTDAVQALTLQFGLADDQAMRIADTLTSVASGLRINFQQGITSVSDAVKVSGIVAKDAGYSLEEYAAIVGSVVEKTRLGGEQIGNAMKTISSRIGGAKTEETNSEDISKVEKVYSNIIDMNGNKIPIAIRKSETEFRKQKDTLDDLANIWDKLSNVEKNRVAEASAGIRQVNIFKAMMDSWGKSTESATKATEAQGSALKKQEIYMQSTEAKIKTLTATLESFWQNFLDSKIINSIVSFFTSLTNGISKVSDAIGGGTPILLGLIAIIASLIVGFGGLTWAITSLTAAWAAFDFVTAGIPLLIGAVVVGVSALIMNFDKLKDKYNEIVLGIEKFNEAQETEIKNTTNDLASKDAQSRKIDDLIKKYDELTNKTKLNKNEVVQLKSIQDQLYELYPNLNSAINNITGSYNMQTSAIQNLNDTQKQYIKDMASLTEAQASSQIALASQQEKDAQKNVEQAEKYINYATEFNKKLNTPELIDQYGIVAKAREAGTSSIGMETGKNKQLSPQTIAAMKEFEYYTGKSITEVLDQKEAEKLIEQKIIQAHLVVSQSGKDAEKMIKARKDLDDAKNTLDALSKGVVPPKKETPPPSSDSSFSAEDIPKGGTSADKEIDEKTIILDRYISINLQIEKYNQLIAEGKALQENTTLENKNKLLENQIENLKILQGLSHEKAEILRRERSELESEMSKKPDGSVSEKVFKFSGIGDEKVVTNAKEVLKAQNDILDLHKGDKNKTFYNEQKAIYDKLEESFKRYSNIQLKDLGELKVGYQNYNKEIADTYKTISDNKIDILLANNSQSIEALNNRLKDLKTNYNKLGDTEHTKKISNLNSQITTNKTLITELNKEYQDLAAIVLLEDYNTEGWKKGVEELNKIKDQMESVGKTGVDLGKTLQDQKIDKIFESADKSAQDYTKSIENLSVKYDLLDKYDFTGKNIIMVEKLKEANVQLSKDTELLSQLKNQKDKNLLTDDAYNKKVEELSKRTLDSAKSVKALNEELKSNNMDLAKYKVDMMSQSFAKFTDTISNLNSQLQLQKEWRPQGFEEVNSIIDKIITANDDAAKQSAVNDMEYVKKAQEAEMAGDQELWKFYDEEAKKAYDQQKSYISDNAKNAREILQNQFSAQNLELEKSLFGGTEEDAKSALEDKQKQNVKYMSGLEKQYSLQLLQLNLEKWNAETLNQKIDIYDTQIAQMQQMSQISRDDYERLQKSIAIKQLELKLENQQNEKNIKVIRKQDDNSYKWQYEADQKAINETQIELTQAKIDFNKTNTDLGLKEQQDQLDGKDKFMSDVKEIQDKALGGQYGSQSEFTDAMNKLSENYKNKYNGDWNNILNTQRSNNFTMEGYFSNLKTNYSTFTTTMSELSKTMGDTIQKDLERATIAVAALQAQVAAAAQAQVTTTGTKSGGSYTAAQGSTFNSVLSQEKSGQVSAGSANTYAQSLGYTGNAGVGQGNAAFQMAAAMSLKRDSGGVLPNGMTAINTSGKPEYVLSPQDFQNILNSKNILNTAFATRDIYNSLKPTNTNELNANNTNSGGNITINEMTVETNDATQFTQDLRSLAIREK